MNVGKWESASVSMSRVAVSAAIVAALAMAVPTVRAQAGGTAPPPQPAISLPAKDILNPDAASGQARGANRPAQPRGAAGSPTGAPAAGEGAGGTIAESDREIRRPAEPAGRIEKKPACPQPAGAASDERPVSRQGAAKGFWRASDFLPLAIVLGLVLAAAWVVKRYMPARRLVTGAGVLEIVARMPVSSKQSLVLVKMGRQLILVGVSPERVNTICLVDDPDRVAELVGRMASQGRDSAGSAFGQSLEQQAGEFEPGTERDQELQAGGPVRGLLEKVRRLSKSGVC